jgi:hypothetical protein
MFASTRQPVNAQDASRALPVTSDSKQNVTSQTGKLVIQPQFDDAYRFSEGLAAVKIGDKWGFIDKTGKLVIPPQFESISESYENEARSFKTFSEGVAGVQVGEKKWGYIDKTGKFVIPPKFEFVTNFSEGVARVWIGNKSGYIDKTGKFIIFQ